MSITFNGNKPSRGIVIAEKAFSADEAIFLARIAIMKDRFVVPPRNDDFWEFANGSITNDLYLLTFFKIKYSALRSE